MSNKVEVLVRLFETIEKRSMDDPSQSYTAQLLSEGKEKCIAKLKEESLETIEAAEKEEISQIISDLTNVEDITFGDKDDDQRSYCPSSYPV